jgi:hypothetical protein
MTISVKETTVFSVFHPDAHDLFNTCSDLKKVAWELADPERRLNDDVRNMTMRVRLRHMMLINVTGQDNTAVSRLRPDAL